ncbi:MAG: hypothetical protein ABI177_01885 [Edaphobacter sp.]
MHLHKAPKLPVLPPVLTPIPLVTLPPPANPPLIPTPVVTMPPMPIAAAAATPRRERRRLAPKSASAPAEGTTPEPEPMTDEAAIGDLTAGGAANPQAQHEAASLIHTIELRVNGLSPQIAKKQRSQVNRVRNFWKQAQEALNSGDVEGATTLATKAKLLLDDLDRQGGE